jgi:hypothetical protein
MNMPTMAATMLGNWSEADLGRRGEAAGDVFVLQCQGVVNVDGGLKSACNAELI